jgi:phage FluMu protein Com
MTSKTTLATEEPVPCPKCGKLPETAKTGSYWVTRCPTAHMFKVAGHVMKTKREAIHEWNVAYKAQ